MSDDDIRDQAISYRFRATGDALHDYGLQSGDAKQDLATAALLGQLADLAARNDPRFVSYSRRKEWYASASAKYLNGTPMTFHRVTRAADAMDHAGLIEHQVARRSAPDGSGRPRFQSRLRAAPRAFDKAVQVEMIGPTLIMRDAEGFQMPFPENYRSERIRRQLVGINDMLAGVIVGGPDLVMPGYMDSGNGILIPVHRPQLCRIFKGDLEHGGRAYAMFQNLPKDVRCRFTLNGSPVFRKDHKCLHPQLLYALAGLDFDPAIDDAYDLPGWPRELVKTAFNVLVNAKTLEAARTRCCYLLGKLHGDTRIIAVADRSDDRRHWAWHELKTLHGREADQLINDIVGRHSRIAHLFGSGVGLELQNIDAKMALEVTDKLLKRGVPTLPIHDEHLATSEGLMTELMDAALAKAKNTLKKDGLKCTPETAVFCGVFGAVVPHSAPCPSPAPAVGPSQLRFGGLVPIEVGPELATFAGGVMPERLREAVLHELGARGLTQDKAAAYLGLSRPQLTNALRGRFGLGREPAARLRRLMAA